MNQVNALVNPDASSETSGPEGTGDPPTAPTGGRDDLAGGPVGGGGPPLPEGYLFPRGGGGPSRLKSLSRSRSSYLSRTSRGGGGGARSYDGDGLYRLLPPRGSWSKEGEREIRGPGLLLTPGGGDREGAGRLWIGEGGNWN